MILNFENAFKFILLQFLNKNKREYNDLNVAVWNGNVQNDDLTYECFLEYIKKIKLVFKIVTTEHLINLAIKKYLPNVSTDDFIINLTHFLSNLSEDIHCTYKKLYNGIVFNVMHFNNYFYPGILFNDKNASSKFNQFLTKNNLQLRNGFVKFSPEYNIKEKIFDQDGINILLNINLENEYVLFHIKNILINKDFFLKNRWWSCSIVTNKKEFGDFILWVLEYNYENIRNNYDLKIKRRKSNHFDYAKSNLFFIHKNDSYSPLKTVRRILSLVVTGLIIRE